MTEAAAQTQMEHAHGTFCWIELATTDGPGAKKFYTDLFGWEFQDNPMGPDMVYTIYKINGKDHSNTITTKRRGSNRRNFIALSRVRARASTAP